MAATPRNDPQAPLTKFCLAVEEHRRTADGRVKTSQQFVAQFFTQSETAPQDRIFLHLPKEVRGPLMSHWGIRGAKAALRDTDEKVAAVVSDALIATDLSPGAFEEGLTPAIVIAWVPLSDWWSFWRGGVLTKAALSKSLVTAYELGLFDAAWMFEHLESKNHKGTDVVSETLGKEDLGAWIRQIHAGKDGSDKGILLALGWDKLIAKTNNDSLIGLLDALALKVGLTVAEPAEKTDPPAAGASPAETPAVGVAQEALASLSPAKAPEGEFTKAEPASSLASAVIAHAARAAEPSVSKKASVPPAAPSGDPDMEETGPYAAPAPAGSKKNNNAPASAASKPGKPAEIEIPIIPVSLDDDPETDETRRHDRRAAMTSKSGR